MVSLVLNAKGRNGHVVIWGWSCPAGRGQESHGVENSRQQSRPGQRFVSPGCPVYLTDSTSDNGELSIGVHALALEECYIFRTHNQPPEQKSHPPAAANAHEVATSMIMIATNFIK